MSASSSAMRTRRGLSASVVEPVMAAIVAVAGPRQRPRGHPLWWETAHEPSYPNWQRKRIQNPYSVSSNLTEGTCVMSQGIGIVLDLH